MAIKRPFKTIDREIQDSTLNKNSFHFDVELLAKKQFKIQLLMHQVDLENRSDFIGKISIPSLTYNVQLTSEVWR